MRLTFPALRPVQPVKTTLKLFFGLAYGLQPLLPRWVFDSVRDRRWLPPAQQHMVPLPSSSSCLRPVGLTTPERDRLLAGTIAVPLGDARWKVSWGALLRSAGATVRHELPPQHHSQVADGAAEPQVVVVVDIRADPSTVRTPEVRGLLGRACDRGAEVTTQEWLRQSLLQSAMLDTRDFPLPPSLSLAV